MQDQEDLKRKEALENQQCLRSTERRSVTSHIYHMVAKFFNHNNRAIYTRKNKTRLK